MATPVRLDIGSTIDAAFNVVRRNPRATLLPVTAVSIASAVITYGALAGVAAVLGAWEVFEQLVLGIGTNPLDPAASDVGTPTNPFADVATPDGGAIALAVLLGLVFLLGATLLGAVSYACVVQQVGSLVGDREPLPFGAAVRAALVAGLRVLPVWLLLTVGSGLALGLVVGLVAALEAVLPVAAVVLLGLAAFGLVVVGGLYLAVRLCLFPAVFALEGRSFGSLRRSWELTAGNVPRVGLVLLVAVLLSLAISFGVGIVSAPIQILSSGNEAVGRVLAFAIVIPLSILGSILGLVAIAAPLTIAYLRLRAATEGDDLAVAAQRFSESAGVAHQGSSAAGGGAAVGSGGSRPAWDFTGGAADSSWVSRHSPPPAADEPEPRTAAEEGTDRERFGPSGQG